MDDLCILFMFCLFVCSEHLNSSLNAGEVRQRDKMKQGKRHLLFFDYLNRIFCSVQL